MTTATTVSQLINKHFNLISFNLLNHLSHLLKQKTPKFNASSSSNVNIYWFSLVMYDKLEENLKKF